MNGLKQISYLLVTFMFLISILSGCDSNKPNNQEDGPNEPPDTPFNPTPAHTSNFQSIETEIFWRCLDPDGDALTYDVFFGIDENPPLIVEKQADTLCLLGTLDYFTTYYWKVNAFDNYGDSATGPLWRFTTEASPNLPPNPPGYPSPADGATDQPIALTFSWTSSDPDGDDTLSYYVYFDTTSNPAPASGRLTDESFNPGLLNPETHYYWRVVAYDNYGDSTSGPVWEFTTGAAADGIFAALVVGRIITIVDDTPFALDEIVARFDSAYAPCIPVTPLEADGVTCNEYLLLWHLSLGLHKYTDPYYSPFIELGDTYVFEVFGNLIIPALIDSIDFPSTEPILTDPVESDTVSISGFDIVWTGAEEGTTVRFVLITDVDTTGTSVETANDGSYTMTSEDLEPLGELAGEYGLLLVRQNSKAITADGYDSRGYIWARVMNLITIYVE